ncbi:Lactose permease [Colletotrichum siamense]|uniref:Lactose permease n=1 Tax=Colletotrichum siamense TaxID=690259 RepID=A0A9P5K3I6_COLSI|nr:Lactose permease [Colletotrichum siamense]KAF4857895.1 Lactose permease [Colletotrichum siamense]
MANLPTATAEPGLLDLTNTPTLPWWKDQGLRKLIFWQTCILAAQITVGYDEVIVGSFQALQPWQDAMGNPSAENLGLITCMVFIGGFFGALLAAAPADRYGRRFALQIGSFLGVVGSVMQAASPNRNVFVGGRAVLGVGLSFTTTAGPNLLTELAHPRLRGKMASMFNVLWYLGSIIASWLTFGTGHLSSNWSWRIPSIVQTAFPFLLMIATIFIPESPRWLCSRGRQIEAKDFLIKYHANGNESDPVIDLEMHEIATALNLEEQSKMYTWSNLLKSKANRRRLGICLSVSVLTLWNGQGVISYYFSPILDSVGITNTTQQTGINGGMAIWNLICSVTGAFLADRIGRRRLWLISFIGMIFANVPLTITSAMYANHGSQAAAYGTVVFLFLYNAAFNIACNPLLYCYTPEILPYSIRSKGLALQVLSSQVMLTVNQYVNPIALERIGYYYFIFYLGMLFLGLALIYFTFPETKGYSLEELGMLFDDGFDVRPSILHGKDVENTSHTAQDDARKDNVKIIEG